jgi:hypothetical protein
MGAKGGLRVGCVEKERGVAIAKQALDGDLVEPLDCTNANAPIKCVPSMFRRDDGTLTITMLTVSDLIADKSNGQFRYAIELDANLAFANN